MKVFGLFVNSEIWKIAFHSNVPFRQFLHSNKESRLWCNVINKMTWVSNIF
jgi:hypothetical protein